MTKLMTRNGGMLSCGWLPPTVVTVAAFSVPLGAVLNPEPVHLFQKAPDGEF